MCKHTHTHSQQAHAFDRNQPLHTHSQQAHPSNRNQSSTKSIRPGTLYLLLICCGGWPGNSAPSSVLPASLQCSPALVCDAQHCPSRARARSLHMLGRLSDRRHNGSWGPCLARLRNQPGALHDSGPWCLLLCAPSWAPHSTKGLEVLPRLPSILFTIIWPGSQEAVLSKFWQTVLGLCLKIPSPDNPLGNPQVP